jgi:hypothetical protein
MEQQQLVSHRAGNAGDLFSRPVAAKKLTRRLRSSTRKVARLA